MSFKKKAVVTAVAMTIGTAGAISTASAATLTLTFADNAAATAPGGTLVGFAAGSEFHVATPSGVLLNDGDKDIIAGGETWSFGNGLSNTSVVSALMTGTTGGDTNAGHSGANGSSVLTAGISGFPIASAPGTHGTIGKGADFLMAGNFTILAPTTTSASGIAFGAAHITAFDTGAGTFSVKFPVLHVQWADGAYLIGADGDGNGMGAHGVLKCAANGPCPGAGVTLSGTLNGSGGFNLSGSQSMTKDEVTVGGFNKQTVEFSLGGTYTTTFAHAAVPVPAAAWLFGSGLMGMVGVARRRRNKA